MYLSQGQGQSLGQGRDGLSLYGLSLYGLRCTGFAVQAIAVPLRHKAFVQFCVYMPLLTSQIFSAGMRHIYMLEQTTLFPIRHSPTADAMEHGTRGYAARKNTFLGILV